ncbi:pre-mrna-splicing factor cwc26 [Ophiocordyceps camponoti-floridani]|uniref:Pre-mrna-splicing factor cwc26 n=1 Tax=Ophiocordyceps camponoti-floridani TaxID=2030778 RepID=A0A8H4Q3Z0_9HYPO|nr:pre-mrna-splicing factor cwc26 [Ophiocordyceps camponoti-floridani]
MPSDLAEYLASRYLVADSKKTSKKRKRKRQDASNLLITDDDSTWLSPNAQPADDQDEDGPTTVSGSTADFRKAKKSGWRRAGFADSKGDEAVADAVIAAVAAENQAARAADDEAPVIDNVVMMSDGTHAGLQSAAAVSAQLKRRRREEEKEFEAHRQTAQEQETVYRDATGRRIDISMKRAEARRAALEAEQRELQAKEALKGEAQLEAARKRREQLSDAKAMAFARTADDEQMNKELREKERWNDPMAQFMQVEKKAGSGNKVSKRHPTYSGAAAPNRYGIRPGYRWDGVDRGNGMEAKRFKALNQRERNKALAYSWQMDE